MDPMGLKYAWSEFQFVVLNNAFSSRPNSILDDILRILGVGHPMCVFFFLLS